MPSASSEGTGFDIGQDQASQVKDLTERLSALIVSIEAHPQFNKQVPKDSNSTTVFYTWDFVQRTRHILSTIDIAKLESLEEESTKVYMDVIGRNRLSHLLITDMSGQMQRMITQGGPAADFGPETRARVEALRPAGAAE